MGTFLEFQEDFSIQKDHIAVVKASSDGKTCTVFTPGQSAVDGGFTIQEKFSTVMDHILGPDRDVHEAAKALLDVFDRAAPYMQDMAEFAASSKHPYSGPSFANEIEDLRIALKQAE